MGWDWEGVGSRVATEEVIQGKALGPEKCSYCHPHVKASLSPAPSSPRHPTPASGGLEPHTISAHSLLPAPFPLGLAAQGSAAPCSQALFPQLWPPAFTLTLSMSTVPTLISSPLTLAAPPPPQLLNPHSLPNPSDLKV